MFALLMCLMVISWESISGFSPQRLGTPRCAAEDKKKVVKKYEEHIRNLSQPGVSCDKKCSRIVDETNDN